MGPNDSLSLLHVIFCVKKKYEKISMKWVTVSSGSNKPLNSFGIYLFRKITTGHLAVEIQ